MRRGSSRFRGTLFRAAALLVFLSAAIAAAPAQEQPNPYRFPAASGVSIPILEGYWAAAKEDCAALRLKNEDRPHVGLKGFGIENNGSAYWYFGPRLGNWPDGLCWVTRIKREAGSRYSVSGFCGSEPGDRHNRDSQFSAAVTVHGERHISVSGQGVLPLGDYFFCKSVLRR